MIREEIKNIRSNKSELRKFGIAMGIVFGLLGGLPLWRAKDSYPYFLFLSLLIHGSRFIHSSDVKTCLQSVDVICHHHGLVYDEDDFDGAFYLIFTPIGFIARSFGKDFFPRQFDQSSQSYWILEEKAGI